MPIFSSRKDDKDNDAFGVTITRKNLQEIKRKFDSLFFIFLLRLVLDLTNTDTRYKTNDTIGIQYLLLLILNQYLLSSEQNVQNVTRCKACYLALGFGMQYEIFFFYFFLLLLGSFRKQILSTLFRTNLMTNSIWTVWEIFLKVRGRIRYMHIYGVLISQSSRILIIG